MKNMKNLATNSYFHGCEWVQWCLNVKNLKRRAHREPALNSHAKFQPFSSVWKGDTREVNSKNKKNLAKNSVLGLYGSTMGLKS